MASTTPKVSLRLWDQLNDPYSHDQLSDNWSKMDFHDHTPGRGVQIPTEGIADGAITPAKVAASLDPGPAYSTWKNLRSGAGTIGASVVAGSYVLAETNNAAAGYPAAQPLNVIPYYQFFDPADYAVSGRTVRYRLQVTCFTSATAPGANFSVNLFPASYVGATFTVGSATPGMTVTFSTPAANSVLNLNGSEVAAPVAGIYALGVTNSATTAVGSTTVFRATLQMRQT